MEINPQVKISRTMPRLRSSLYLALSTLLLLPLTSRAHAQDWVRTGSNLGVEKIRMAAADFKPNSSDPQTPVLKATFDNTLYNDLANAGFFDMVPKSMAPPATPATPAATNLAQWAAAPANAAMLALCSLAVQGGRLNVSGFLVDVKEAGAPAIVGKQYG